MTRETLEPHRPIIGITANLKVEVNGERSSEFVGVTRAYCSAVARAGGHPCIIPCDLADAHVYAEFCSGFLFTGGKDADMELFGKRNDPRVTLVARDRQTSEIQLLQMLDHYPDRPVLGVCLGMQMMALHAGGNLHQVLEDVCDTADSHRDYKLHGLRPTRSSDKDVVTICDQDRVPSNHRQSVADPGRMHVVAWSDDDVIEGIAYPRCERRFYMGAQWHPEVGGDGPNSLGLIQRFVEAAHQHAMDHNPAALTPTARMKVERVRHASHSETCA